LNGSFVVFWDGTFTPGSDGAVITGSDYRDLICGTTGNDWIYGKQGNDRIFGMGSDGYTPADPGPPAVTESWGDNLFGNKGHDLVVNGELGVLATDGAFLGGGQGNDVLYAGDGDFSFARGGVDFDTVVGGDGNDQELRGGAQADSVYAGTGDRHHAYGNMGDDTVYGGSGDDQIIQGNNQFDYVVGGSGADQRLFGGMADDVLEAGTGSNQALFGGQGNDTINEVGLGLDQVADGGPGDDEINPSATDSFWAFGGAGNDSLFGGTDADCLWGDYATDQTELDSCGAGAFPGVTLTLDAAFISAAVTGDDWLEGGESADFLFGGPGDDVLYATAPGLDLYDIGDGDIDELFGGTGDDTGLGFCEPGGAASSDEYDGGTGPLGAVDTSYKFWVANTTDVETELDSCDP
jgi:Ca2+-binding RTX toxin-like protein